MKPESIKGVLEHQTSFGPFDDIKMEEVTLVSVAYPGIEKRTDTGILLDGIGALLDGDYMEPPILGFRIDALHDSAQIGYTLGGFSAESGVGYSAKTKVEKPYRRCGLGGELLHQKLRILRKLDASVVHSMVASDAGRGLVENHGFLYNEALTRYAIDEFWTNELYEYFNEWVEIEQIED